MLDPKSTDWKYILSKREEIEAEAKAEGARLRREEAAKVARYKQSVIESKKHAEAFMERLNKKR